MEEKTIEQKKIDIACGCLCHEEIHTTKNYMWCGNCHEKHIKDTRYPEELLANKE